MNSEPKNATGEKVLPEGFENWPSWKIDAFNRGGDMGQAEQKNGTLERSPQEIKKRAAEWYTSQDRAVKDGILGALASTGALENGDGEGRKKELIEKSARSRAGISGIDILAGLNGEGAPKKNVAETPDLTFSLEENRLPPRQGFGPAPEVMTPTAPAVAEIVHQQTEQKEELFIDPSVLKHEVGEGDSIGVILERIMQTS